MAEERTVSMEPTALVHISTSSVVLSSKMTVIASERSEPPATFSNHRRTNSELKSGPTHLLSEFIKQHQELRSHKYVPCGVECRIHFTSTVNSHGFIHRNGKPVVLDGHTLTVAGVVAAARYGACVTLNESPKIRERMEKSRSVLVNKVQANKSVYGVSTGLGGSGACSSQSVCGPHLMSDFVTCSLFL
jgi:hypothetical protein